jgi:hypothetical protein
MTHQSVGFRGDSVVFFCSLELNLKTTPLPRHLTGTQEDLETSAAAEAVAEMAKAEPGAPQAQLEQLLSYLRSRFYYCYFCGAAYASQEELLQACPGAREEDH